MNYKTFFAAYKTSQQRGNTATREEIVLEFTEGRTTSLKDLTAWELQELTRRLNTLNGFEPKAGDCRGRASLAMTKPGEKQRRNIIAMAHEMRWHTASGKADMQRVNEWVANVGYLHADGKHATINDYTEKELPKLVWQFKQAHQHFLKNII